MQRRVREERALADVKTKWVRDWIEDLMRERDTAVQALNDYCDNQTESPLFYDDSVCTGEDRGPSMKRRYIQHYKVSFDYAGFRGELVLFGDEVTFRFDSQRGRGRVGIAPDAANSIHLVHARKG